MTDHEIDMSQSNEQGASPEGMRQQEEQAPEQEEREHEEQGVSDQEQQAQIAAQETEHEHSAEFLHATAQQGEMSTPQQDAGERIDPTQDQQDDAVKSSSPVELTEREAVSVALEQVGGTGE